LAILFLSRYRKWCW